MFGEIEKELLNVNSLNQVILKFIEGRDLYYSNSYYWNLQREEEKSKFEQMIKQFETNK